MTRKFRAWDSASGQFIYFELFCGENNHTPPIYKGADLSPWKMSTGFTDRNGTEIYEGDVLRYTKYTGRKNEQKHEHHDYVVMFSEKGQWVMERGEIRQALWNKASEHEIFSNFPVR